MTAVDSTTFFSVEHVAALLNVSKMTVYRLIHTRQLRAFRVNRSFRIQSRDLDRFMRGADTFEGDVL